MADPISLNEKLKKPMRQFITCSKTGLEVSFSLSNTLQCTAIFVYWRRTKISICLLEQNGVKTNKRTVLRTLRSDFLAWLRFVVLTFRALCNAGRVDTIHVPHTTFYAKHPRTQQTHDMARAQYYSEWTDLGYGMARLFDSFVPRWLMKAQPLLCVAIWEFGYTHISAWHARPHATPRWLRHDFSCHGQPILSDSNNNFTCNYSRLVLVG